MTKVAVLPSPTNGVDPFVAELPARDHLRNHNWADIVARIQAGQKSGIEELYRVLNRGVRYYLGRQLGHQDLEDKLHEVLLIVVSAIQNGSGKSSLYRALRLLGDAAMNSAVSSLAREGGLPSTLWAGPEMMSPAFSRGDYPLEPTIRRKPVS